MKALFAIACLAVAATSAWFLLSAFVRVLRGKKTQILRNAAAMVLMIFALWQSYLLKPAPTVWMVYACVPAAIAGALLILLSGIREVTSYEPGEGPERRVPAMALRVPQPQHEEEELKVAVGGRRVA
jgi:hypothetical protein